MIFKKDPEKLLRIGIVFSMLLWGLSWPSAKVLTGYLSMVDFVLWRYILVVVTMFFLLLIFKIPFSGNSIGIPNILISGCLLAFYSYLFYRGLKEGMAGAGGVLVTTLNPIFAYFLSIVINRKMPTRREQTGLLFGLLAGCFLLKIWDQSQSIFDSGNIFFLAASFIWAVMSVFTSKAKKFGTSFGFSFWQYVVSMFCMLPFVHLKEFVSIIHISDSVFWLNMIFSASIVTALATTFFFYATTKVGPEKASSFIFLVPFAAEVSSWILLDEKMLTHTIAGGILGIVAVYLINRTSFSKKINNSD